jgi:hypothetical protein
METVVTSRVLEVRGSGKRYLHKILRVVRKPERETLSGRPSSKLGGNIKIDLKVIKCKILNWIQAA